MVLPSHLIRHFYLPSDEDYKTLRSYIVYKVSAIYVNDKILSFY